MIQYHILILTQTEGIRHEQLFHKAASREFQMRSNALLPDEILREFYRRMSEVYIGSLKAFCKNFCNSCPGVIMEICGRSRKIVPNNTGFCFIKERRFD